MATTTPEVRRNTVVINAIPLMVTADDKSKIAGDANPPLTATFAGLVGTDAFQLRAITTTATAGEPGRNLSDYRDSIQLAEL